MIGRQAIFNLLPDRRAPCISIYVPTNGADSAEHDAVRVQNLLRCVGNDMQLHGVDGVDTNLLVDGTYSRQFANSFWREPGEGVAVFLAPDFCCIEHLPYPVPTQYRIGDRFQILPLLPLIDPFQRFFVLSLNQEHIQFFEATSHSMREIEFVATPAKRDSAPTLPFPKADGSGRSLATSAPSHAFAAAVEEHPHDLLESLKSIDRQLHGMLAGEESPLVLAGFGFIASLYEGVNSYRHLLPVRIPGSPSNWTTNELHMHAVDIVMPFLDRAQQTALSAFAPDEMERHTTTCASEIVIAADRGQIETLFLARYGECDGYYDSERQRVTLDPAGDNLQEISAARTLLGGGQVCVLDSDEMPGRHSIGAILKTSDVTQHAPYNYHEYRKR